MTYAKQTWADLPSTTTPFSAARMNVIEQGIADIDTLTATHTSQIAAGDITNSASPAARSVMRVYTPQQFGAVGDGVADDTVAVQAAINAALASTDPINVEKPTFTGSNGTVFLPIGTYSVTELQVAGTIRIVGAGGGTYGNSTLLQRTAGASIVRLKADTDGLSNSTVFENMSFKSQSGTSATGVAQVITDVGISSNSVYFRHCWFKSPERYAIWLTQGDDIQVDGCTFDVSAFHSIRLGNSTTGKITNATIQNNTFYNIALNHIQVENVHGLAVVGNRAYSNGTPSTGSVFVNSVAASAIEAVAVSGNEVDGLQGFVLLQTQNTTVAITGNVLTRIAGYLVALNGGGIFYALTFVANSCTSVAAFTSAPFTGAGCGLQQSIISHNSVTAGATTALMFDLSDARVTGNLLNSNVSLRFTANNNFATPANNGA